MKPQRKWFNTFEERKAYEAKCEAEMEKLSQSLTEAMVNKVKPGPKPKDPCDAKSKDYRNNGAALSHEELWLVGASGKGSKYS